MYFRFAQVQNARFGHAQASLGATLTLRIFLIALNRFHVEVLDEVVVLGDFGFGEVQVHLHAIAEEFRRLGGVAEEQLAHHAGGVQAEASFW